MKLKFRYGYRAVLAYLALFLGMLLLNFTMNDFEPFSLALLAAALLCGFSAPAAAGLYILAGGISLTEGGIPFAAVAAQGVLLGGYFFICEKKGRAVKGECVLLLAAACALFLWLFGRYVYADYAKAAVIAAAMSRKERISIPALRLNRLPCLRLRDLFCRFPRSIYLPPFLLFAFP